MAQHHQTMTPKPRAIEVASKGIDNNTSSSTRMTSVTHLPVRAVTVGNSPALSAPRQPRKVTVG